MLMLMSAYGHRRRRHGPNAAVPQPYVDSQINLMATYSSKKKYFP